MPHVRTRLLVYVAALIMAAAMTGAKEIPFTSKSPEALKFLAQGLERLDGLQTPQAAELFRKAIESDPNFAIAYYYLASTATTTEEYFAAIYKAIDLADGASEPERILIQIAKVNIDGNSAAATALLEKLVSAQPESPRAHQLLGIDLRNRQEWAASESEFNKAIAADSQFAPAYNELAYTLAGTGRYAEAIEVLKKYARLRPKDPNPHDSMAEMYLWLGDHQKSIEEYRASLALDPAFVGSINGLGHNQVFQGKFADARQTYDSWLKQAKNYGDSSGVYYWRAVSFLHEGKLEEAIKAWKEENEFGKAHSNLYLQLEAHDNLSRVYREMEDFANSVAESDAVMKLLADTTITPSSRDIYTRSCLMNSAIVNARKGDKAGAQAAAAKLQQVVEKAPSAAKNRQLHFVRGMLAYWDNDCPAAVDHFLQADSTSPQAKYYMAGCLEKQGKSEDAKGLYTWIAKRNRNDMALAMVRPAALRKLE